MITVFCRNIFLKQLDYMANETKYKGEKFKGPERLSPYPLNRSAPPVELVELAAEIAAADDLLSVQAAGKLRVLAEQIENLQQKAREILAQTRQNQELHRADCAFRKITGKVYHLYKNANDNFMFSMIGPAEWRRGSGRERPYIFIGSYRLENDSTWTDVTEGKE